MEETGHLWLPGSESNPACLLQARKLLILRGASVATTAGIAVVGYSLGTGKRRESKKGAAGQLEPWIKGMK